MDILGAVSTVGFPIVVSLYTLFRLEKTILANTDAINNLALMIAKKR